ncbi:MAG: DUF3667 domain-containing protein [Rhodoferax sp.]|nr:DUF3667 domain-containing protein [Rhodoferax sp.]
MRDLMHTFVNLERGPLTFAWALLTRPGHVAREYVEGRRRRHYGPFATLAVLVGLTALAVNWSGFQILSHDGLPSAPTNLLQRHFNLLLLAQLPLLGAICAALFRGAGLRLPEHMVLVAYVLCVRAVFLALVVPVSYLTSTHAPGLGFVFAFWAAWYLYFGWAASQSYAGPRMRSWIRGAVAAAIGHALIIAALVAGSAAYESLVAR